jgi:hypothetical protein
MEDTEEIIAKRIIDIMSNTDDALDEEENKS